ncbi:GTP-binding protein Era [Actinoplanes tereljensis]|uniref:GTPase Era n=1 Tax=Paractinoplanes tereljensis TaxID=571912 RepID=A0A919NY50_9ACTN|nr:hypothetical protein Ate02nite_91300 [Actinoplanes tereljensis]
MTQPGNEGERRLTAGERNELRRQERRAARRTADTTGAAGGTGGAAARGGQKGGGQRGGASAGGQRGGAAGGGQRSGGQRSGGQPGGGQRSGGQRGGGSAGGGQQGVGQPSGGQKNSQAAGAGQGRGPSARTTGRPGSAGGGPARTQKVREVTAKSEPRPESSPPARRVHRHAEAARSGAGDGVYRAGFACFVGRPNAGKSTLTNAIIGQKIAITSNKPQTTRHVIRGILHREDSQLVLVDTPGLHRPRTLLGERLNDLVREVWSETDVIGICFPADEPVGRGDRFISAEMAELKATVIAVVTKVDLVGPQRLAEHLLAVSKLYDFAEIVPVSAVSGHQVQQLVDVLVKHLPESPQLYPDDVLTDEPEQVLIAELIREAALEGVRDELPHSIAVMVEEMQVEGKLTKIYADLYVERDSQKSIVIGTRGTRLKEVGSKARGEIEQLLGTRVYLDLHVRVAKEWQRDPRQLRKLGF